MNLFTNVCLPPKAITLQPDSHIMFIGSCFAEHVGTQLQRRMGETNCLVNPFGVLYNPLSIAQGIEILLNPDQHKEELNSNIFLGQDKIYHSWLHTSTFSDADENLCRKKIIRQAHEAHNFLLTANILCITFGTTRYYKLNRQPYTIVANCHKEPQLNFSECEPSLEELLSLWQNILTKLIELNPNINICFTVSPYRYKKYGFHESQIQKAKLLLLTDMLCKKHNQAVYFPSYEIMMDELRDYRFYAPDMLHPSQQAIEIITTRFTEWTFTESMHLEAEQNLKGWKRSQHRTICNRD